MDVAQCQGKKTSCPICRILGKTAVLKRSCRHTHKYEIYVSVINIVEMGEGVIFCIFLHFVYKINHGCYDKQSSHM